MLYCVRMVHLHAINSIGSSYSFVSSSMLNPISSNLFLILVAYSVSFIGTAKFGRITDLTLNRERRQTQSAIRRNGCAPLVGLSAPCYAPCFPRPSQTAPGSAAERAPAARASRSLRSSPSSSIFRKSRYPPVGCGIPMTARSGTK